MNRYDLDRAAQREEDMLAEQFNHGDLSEDEYRQALSDMHHEYREAEEQARSRWLERGGWDR